MPKAGSVNGRRVYRCGECQRRYTPDASCHRPSAADQERALAIYREDSSMRAVRGFSWSAPGRLAAGPAETTGTNGCRAYQYRRTSGGHLYNDADMYRIMRLLTDQAEPGVAVLAKAVGCYHLR